MIHIEAINEDNVRKICNLKLAEGQENFVASNRDSLVEAYTTVTAGKVALPFGIYDDETPVGFLMIGYDEVKAGEIKGVLGYAYSIWRFMIDERYQGRGYGRRALALAIDYIAALPKGPAEYMYLSYDPENTRAAALYASFGFAETGDLDDGELIAIRKIAL